MGCFKRSALCFALASCLCEVFATAKDVSGTGNRRQAGIEVHQNGMLRSEHNADELVISLENDWQSETSQRVFRAFARWKVEAETLRQEEQKFTRKEIQRDHANIGGDRMGNGVGDHGEHYHNYAPIYAEYLSKFVLDKTTPTLVEVGILTGSGLAMWEQVFPESHIYGFDINTSSFENNVDHLKSLGFKGSHVKVTTMDQMANNTALLRQTMRDDVPSIVVDDGCHTADCNVATFQTFLPVLPSRFLYFLEDTALSRAAIPKIQELCLSSSCQVDVSKHTEMVVIHRGVEGAVMPLL